MGLHQVAFNLKNDGLIRNSRAFETYVRGKHLHDQLQAGTYALSPSMSVEEIVDKFITGDVAKHLLTILPGKTLTEIQAIFKNAGYSQSQINAAFEARQYLDQPVLASLPTGKSLEGYIYPDSFLQQTNTPAEIIVRQALDEMHDHLTPDIIAGFRQQGLTTFEGITLASIVEKEVSAPGDREVVAQVFLSRLQQGMRLESNPTVIYAANVLGKTGSLNLQSPYNTYQSDGLPPGPISNVSESSLYAVAHPAKTDYLFFVAGDDDKTHFSKTFDAHQDAVVKYCKIKCQSL
jgi:UPF0755 protein